MPGSLEAAYTPASTIATLMKLAAPSLLTTNVNIDYLAHVLTLLVWLLRLLQSELFWDQTPFGAWLAG